MRLYTHFYRSPQVVFLIPTISISLQADPFINIHNQPRKLVELCLTVRFLCLRAILTINWEA